MNALAIRKSHKLWIVFAGTLVTAIVMVAFVFRSPSLEEVRSGAEAAFLKRDFDEAEVLARRWLSVEPGNNRASVIAARAAIRQGRFATAAEYYEGMTLKGNTAPSDALCEAGEFSLENKNLQQAERFFRYVLQHDPDSPCANEKLAYLLRLTGRYWEAAPLHLRLLRLNRLGVEGLVSLGLGDSSIPNPVVTKWLKDCHENNSSDPRPLTALAREALLRDDTDRALQLARRAIQLDAAFIPAHAIVGQSLVNREDVDALAHWKGQLPNAAADNPAIWVAQAEWARLRDQPRVAVRCYIEALWLDPNRRNATFQLCQVLGEIGEEELKLIALERTVQLDELNRAVRAFYSSRNRSRFAQDVAEVLASQERSAEAKRWRHIAAAIDNPALSLNGVTSDSNTAVKLPPENHLVQQLLAAASTDAFPLPAEPLEEGGAAISDVLIDTSQVDIHFEKSADISDLKFEFVNGEQPSEGILRMHESTGGGVAVLDYDGDHWPDIYFTQGGNQAPNVARQTADDRLYRNVGGGRFGDVTQEARLIEQSFSQGVAVGDFDNDGFPDLYVGNIGANRLLQNNGDGTFTDISSQLDFDARSWTTSCLMADLNGDSLPDIYATNYLQGDDVFTRICRESNGNAASCTPDVFAGAPDQLLLNRGDGRFDDWSDEAGIGSVEGKGMGIVATDFGGTGRLDIFIANDQVANFYFANNSRPESPSFDERGIVSGLAFDRDGHALACMGIAVDDANGDGAPDLFITNFYNESNTLYVQKTADSFVDLTRSARLRRPSFRQLGFGTQFLDADLDGHPDLVVANGHVRRSSLPGVPYKMAPQFFLNVDGNRFAELEARKLGKYFEGEYLGRALAKLDWNRDGRTDFAVTHIGAPAELLTNRTDACGHVLVVRLRGVVSARDAIGGIVRVSSGNRTWTRQLTAGDGYQCSNQRQLVFGLGAATHVDRVEVQWPTRQVQVYSGVDVDQEILLIEGTSSVIELVKLNLNRFR